jgi:hypothetical protein
MGVLTETTAEEVGKYSRNDGTHVRNQKSFEVRTKGKRNEASRSEIIEALEQQGIASRA